MRRESEISAELEVSEEIFNNFLMSSSCNDPYEILGVNRGATESEIDKAYKKLALLLHPDKNKAPGSIDAFQIIRAAASKLTDARQHWSYEFMGDNKNLNNHRPDYCSLFCLEVMNWLLPLYSSFLVSLKDFNSANDYNCNNAFLFWQFKTISSEFRLATRFYAVCICLGLHLLLITGILWFFYVKWSIEILFGSKDFGIEKVAAPDPKNCTELQEQE